MQIKLNFIAEADDLFETEVKDNFEMADSQCQSVLIRFNYYNNYWEY